jgi:hypothetical protein
MPKISEGQYFFGILTALVVWLFVGLPVFLYPTEIRIYEQIPAGQSPQESGAKPEGTSQAPFFVQVIPAPKTAEERTQEAQDRLEHQAAEKWLVRWTAILTIATRIDRSYWRAGLFCLYPIPRYESFY